MLVILDRDGIINQDSTDYIKSVDELIALPGSIDAIARLSQAGYRVGIATNQSGIARGYYDEPMLTAIHEQLCQWVRAAGGTIDAIEYCPHLPDHGCWCRKPNPGLLQAIVRRLQCSLVKVPFVGDKLSDLQAAVAVQAKPVLVAKAGSEVDRLRQHHYPHAERFDSLALYVDALLTTADIVRPD